MMNALIGFIQEAKALQAIDALARSMTTEATVLRGGVKRRQINASGLVPGDIVLFQAGDKVPADLRLLHVRGLQVDESALTGESLPYQRKRRLSPPMRPRRPQEHGFSSSLVTYGTARGIVIATGDATEIGRISELLRTTESLATPLTRKITQFSHVLLWVILALAAVTFAVGLVAG
jgi:cation-transporting P-type ATPase F